MREIEVKLKADDLDAVKTKLNEMKCELSEPIHQHDRIYSKAGETDAWKEAKTGDIVMRIRTEDKGSTFNLKQQLSSELDNTELESKVSDPEAIHKILLLLGYEPQVEVKKIRQKGRLGEYEICLDQVEKLGNFVELEKLTNEDINPETTKEELLSVLESLGLSRDNQETRGYDTQIFQLTHK